MCRSTRGVGSCRYALTGSNPAAGNHFSASTFIDNWSEEQASSKYAPRNTYRLQPPDKSTEYRECMSTAAAERHKQQRMKQLQQCYLAPCRHSSSRPSSAPNFKLASAPSNGAMSLHEHNSHSSASRPCSGSSSSSSSSLGGSCHSSSISNMLSQRPHSASAWANVTSGSSSSSSSLAQQQHYSRLNINSSTGSRRCWSASATSATAAAASGVESVATTTLGRQQRLEFQDPPVGGRDRFLQATSCGTSSASGVNA
jgi:hypothetical protein